MALSEKAVLAILDTAYERALKGIPGSHTIEQLAEEYKQSVESFIRWQTAKCAVSGFASGLGGLITLPVAVPADIAANFYVQLRMIAVIAHLKGHDPRSDKVKFLAFACLLGNEAKEIVKDVGIELALHVARKLAERAAHRGFVHLGRAVPLVGGVVGGTIDGLTCQAVGKAALALFDHKTDK